MAYSAMVIPVMIASPGDVAEERRTIRDSLHDWNNIHSLSTSAVLMPVGWETHAAPDLGAPAQQLINVRVLAECDLLIGVFWTRLGTPTSSAASGTVEEIQRHLDAGRPAMVYFSRRPVAPQQLDPDQYSSLQEFKKWCSDRGLIQEYDSVDDFRSKFSRELQIQILKSPYIQGLLSRASGVADDKIMPPTAAGIALDGAALTEPAKQLLVEAAADKNGMIIRIVALGGRYFQANGKKIGLSTNPREYARYDHGLEQLLTSGLVVGSGERGEIFRVTDPGYRLADRLRAELS